MKASVLMPVYNTPLAWLQEALNSIDAQSNQDFEFIVVDDNSRPDVTGFLLDSGRIDLLIHRTKNEGLAAALNIGLKNCTGEIIIRMDSDDIAHPNLVSSHIDFFNRNKNKCISGIEIELFSDAKTWQSHHLPIVNKDVAYKKNGFWITNHPGIAFRRSVIEQLGGYDNTPLGYAEDYALWVKFLLAGYNIYNRPELLMRYRVNNRPERHTDEWFTYLEKLKKKLYE